jgi:pilus assembly protein Flp/PilA
MDDHVPIRKPPKTTKEYSLVDTMIRLWLSVSLSVRDRINRNERGAALVEYALLVGLIAAVCIALITALGTQVQARFQTACTALKGSAC